SGGCSTATWNDQTVYLGDGGLGAGNGEVVSFNGKEYRAQWWIQGGSDPSAGGPWLEVGDCNIVYDTDHYGIRKKGQSSYFEIQLKDYSSPQTNTIGTAVTPTISVGLANGETWPICSGGTINLEASVANEGSSPVITWYVADVQVQQSSSTTYTYSGTTTGEAITVSLNSSANCVTSNDVGSVAVNSQVDICTGVKGLVKDGTSLYPNPTTSFTTVRFSPARELRLLGVQGQVLQTLDLNGKSKVTLDLTNYINGTYVVQITLDDGSSVVTEVQKK
ncbi:MAG: hypothetical protein ACJA0Q_000646, partial [Saprospiraceae bacterium]